MTYRQDLHSTASTTFMLIQKNSFESYLYSTIVFRAARATSPEDVSGVRNTCQANTTNNLKINRIKPVSNSPCRFLLADN